MPTPGTAHGSSCTVALRDAPPCTPATAAPASRPCREARGGPRSNPATDVESRSAPARKTAADTTPHRRATPAAASSARLLGSTDVLPHRRRRGPQARRNRPAARTRGVVQRQNLPDLPHGQPLVRRRDPLPRKPGESHGDRLSRVAQLRGSDPSHRFGAHRKSDHVPTGIDVHFGPDSVFTLLWNTHTTPRLCSMSLSVMLRDDR